jgi:hypothetical protein
MVNGSGLAIHKPKQTLAEAATLATFWKPQFLYRQHEEIYFGRSWASLRFSFHPLE